MVLTAFVGMFCVATSKNGPLLVIYFLRLGSESMGPCVLYIVYNWSTRIPDDGPVPGDYRLGRHDLVGAACNPGSLVWSSSSESLCTQYW